MHTEEIVGFDYLVCLRASPLQALLSTALDGHRLRRRQPQRELWYLFADEQSIVYPFRFHFTKIYCCTSAPEGCAHCPLGHSTRKTSRPDHLDNCQHQSLSCKTLLLAQGIPTSLRSSKSVYNLYQRKLTPKTS